MLGPDKPEAAGSYRQHLINASDRILELYAAASAADFDRPVPGCPDWKVRDLLGHLAMVEGWAHHAITQHKPGDWVPQPDLPDPTKLRGLRDQLLTVLDADPGQPAWTFGANRNLAFWQRRQAHEHLIHRIDLEQALGIELSPIDAELADDGVAEAVEVFLPRQVKQGRLGDLPGAVELRATDTGSRWSLSAGAATEVMATVEASAVDLLLLLWKRARLDEVSVRSSGDDAVRDVVLAAPLVP